MSRLLARQAGFVPPAPLVISTFDHGRLRANQYALYLLSSLDGRTFAPIPGVTNPFKDMSSVSTQASSILHRAGKYWLAYEVNNGGNEGFFRVASATALGGPYTDVADVTVTASPASPAHTWNPRWLVDDDGTVHVVVNHEVGGVYDSHFQPYIVDALDNTFTSWGAAAAITGTFPANMIDCFPLPRSVTPSGKYAIWFKDEVTHYIGYMESASLKTGYTVTRSGNWLGLGPFEGVMLAKAGRSWRLYLDDYIAAGVGGFVYVDSHDGWATWDRTTTPIVAPIVTGTGGFVIEGDH